MFKRALLCLLLILSAAFVFTGCDVNVDKNQRIINHATLPGHTFDSVPSGPTYDNTTSITTAKNGVVIYKDNSLHDETNSNASTTNVDFGPGSVKFGPGRN